MTHEEFIHVARDIAVSRLSDDGDRKKLVATKLVYGSGDRGTRGICIYRVWQNGDRHELIEVSAAGEVSPVQLAGTTIHDLAHCLAGPAAGHGTRWRSAAKNGLQRAEASGQSYHLEDFHPDVRDQIGSLPSPTDGKPVFFEPSNPTLQRRLKSRPCPLGIGIRGGRSRGPGSGSRLRRYECLCQPKAVIAWVARDDFKANCQFCGMEFGRVDKFRWLRRSPTPRPTSGKPEERRRAGLATEQVVTESAPHALMARPCLNAKLELAVGGW